MAVFHNETQVFGCNIVFHEILSYSILYEPRHEISNNVVCATSEALDQPVQTHSLIKALAFRLNIL